MKLNLLLPYKIEYMNNHFWGRMGEAEVRDWLISEGHLILASNWRSGKQEIDLITQMGFNCHFIEVKTRFIRNSNSKSYVSGIQDLIIKQFNHHKQQNMKKAMKQFSRNHPKILNYKIDFYTVLYFTYGKYIYHFKRPIL